ncbi:MAG: valine--tRNA ligase [Deltaproteobacteria bacterium]|nr:valine--tRNA ligase [Deltaproteobacteria bacterium]
MSTELAKAYEPREVEERWAKEWIRLGLFVADPSAPGESFTIVIPPPNITGQLHLGHALNNTLQDVLIRYKKMDGANTLWLPGTDHASIATQNVVERMLASEGTDRHAVGRERFLERTFAWKGEIAPYIVAQLQRLGASCDWTRERFTMDEGLSRAVREVFVRLYEDGLIYRGRRLINWCCRCGTALSDIEVEHEDVEGHLWHLRYPLASGDGHVVVATTRPETLLGDTAVAVHPEDPRYAGLVGKTVRLPVLGREIPLIADEHVDREFGSGAVKITPGHDFNDFEIGERHGLPAISVIDEQGRMTEEAGPYAGLDRASARERIVADLEASGTLEKIEPHALAVGTCYRCSQVVEPLLSTQWFVRAKPLADPAIEAVRDGRTRFHPEHWERTYFSWLENIRDWCVSRQLWWGHRIPAWYCDACGPEKVIVSREDPPACPRCHGPLRQDEDVLDTWFSSGLWPFSTLGWPDDAPELRRYYPTSVLVTGFDIIFFWVARMMMFGLRFTGEVPFRDVYVHGLVRDEYGSKMSKSKGNVKDPLELLATYGTDALRFTLIAQSAMGRDIRLSLERIDGNRSFANKIWNATRFLRMNLEGYRPDAPRLPGGPAERWIRTRLSRTIEEARAALDAYRFNDVANVLYRFLWNELCDWYVELAKLSLTGGDADARSAAQQTLVDVLDGALRLLHPLTPFLTEELWRALPRVGETPSSIVHAGYPRAEEYGRDPAAESDIERLIEVVRAVRNLRSELGVKPGQEIAVHAGEVEPGAWATVSSFEPALRALARVGSIARFAGASPPRGAAVAVAGGIEIHVPLAGLVDVAAERERVQKEIERVDKDLVGVQRKLSNDDFVARAPEDIVSKERGRAEELESRRALLARSLERLVEVDR